MDKCQDTSVDTSEVTETTKNGGKTTLSVRFTSPLWMTQCYNLPGFSMQAELLCGGFRLPSALVEIKNGN